MPSYSCSRGHYGLVPLIDVTYNPAVNQAALRKLAVVLPDIVAEGVASPEEPWLGPPQAGDVEIRFREKSRHDVGELACVIEIHSKLLASREADSRERAERILAALADAVPEVAPVGVWLLLHEGAWAQ